MNVLKSLENKGILSEGNTRKTTSQEGRFLTFLMPLMTVGLPFINDVLTPLAENILLPFGLSAVDVAIQKKTYRSGIATLIISNVEMENIMKICLNHLKKQDFE